MLPVGMIDCFECYRNNSFLGEAQILTSENIELFVEATFGTIPAPVEETHWRQTPRASDREDTICRTLWRAFALGC